MAGRNYFLSAAVAATTLLGASSTPALAAAQAIEEIVVTAQRRTESIQDVPIAVSAFGNAELEERRIDDARDLQTAVPNLSYTGTGASGSEGFQIRGVGDAVGGTTGDVGVGVHHNNAPQVQSRIATAEFYDVERVEVLRGPQGTLYGRNATGGVINYITAKPAFEEYDFSITAEAGDYGNRKLKGMANIPLGDSVALRFAGTRLQRDGYTENVATGNDIDDRDLWSGRATLSFEPTEKFRAWVLYERFEEDDSRRAGARTLCIPDAGPTQVGGTAVTNPLVQNFLSQGCLPGTIYQDAAYGRPNSIATFGGRFALLASLTSTPVVPLTNLYAGQQQPTDLRETSEFLDPTYEVEHEITEFELSYDLTPELTLSLLGHQSEDTVFRKAGSFEGSVGFLDSPVTPGGVWTDFQNGSATGMRTLSIFDGYTEQESYELRLQSAFAGPLNFNFGLLTFDVERDNHTWVSTNTTTLYLAATTCAATGIDDCPIYHDQNPEPDYTGHQYFDTWTPYELDSQAIFGELYWNVTDTVKLTAGLRYTDDEKERLALNVQLLSPTGADGIGTGGYPDSAQRVDKVDFQEWTGRLVLDWMPETDFSDSTLLYASYSRGYKSGGFNSPEQGETTFVPYEPEFVNAFELGTKNLFAGGRVQVNGSLFYYDYQDYQISKIEQFSARNENIDAEVWGVELETAFDPVEDLTLFANLGWLSTEVKNGTSIDPIDRTAGDPNYTSVRDYQTGCVVPTAVAEGVVQAVQAGLAPPTAFFAPCTGANALTGAIPGIEKDLSGNDLPNAPEWSAMVGVEYGWQMASWFSTFRLDYSWKDETYVSVFNGESYALDDWDNANATLSFAHPDVGLDVQLFVKNIFDDDTVVGYGVGSDGVGLTRGLTLLDPRLFGVNVTYNF